MDRRSKNWIKLLGVFVMKKALVFGVSLLMMVGLAGCSTSSSSSKNSSSSKAQTAQDKNYVRSGTLTKVD
jgi:outer membrane lipoprotein SlyB